MNSRGCDCGHNPLMVEPPGAGKTLMEGVKLVGTVHTLEREGSKHSVSITANSGKSRHCRAVVCRNFIMTDHSVSVLSPPPLVESASPSSSSENVSAIGVGKNFGSVCALRALNFVIHPGEIVGLLGPNGAGKTTTMKLLMGLLQPSQGTVRVLGRNCVQDARAVKERIGYVADEPSFYDFLTGAETVEFVATMRGVPVHLAWERLASLCQELHFEEERDALVKTYSHGTKKKLALLVAWVHEPPLLLLDEPTNGLDPRSASAVRTWLRQVASKGTSVFVSTHLLDMADTLCDRFLLLNRGVLVASGTSQEVRQLAHLGSDASLESAFLQLTEAL